MAEPKAITGRSILYQGQTVKDPVLISLIEKLERVEKGAIPIQRLPIRELKRVLIQEEPMDPIQMLLPKSVTKDLLAPSLDDLLVQYAGAEEEGKKVLLDMGESSVTWAAANDSETQTVAHRLGVVPTFVGLALDREIAGTTMHTDRIFNRTDTSFQFQYNAEIAITGTLPVLWCALGLVDN